MVERKNTTLDDLRRYEAAGLAGILAGSKDKEDRMYLPGAIGVFSEGLDLQTAQNVVRELGSSTKPGIESFLGIYGKKYAESRERITLADFCDYHGERMEEEAKNVLREHASLTLRDVEKEVEEAQYVLNDPKNHFTEEEKKEAQAKIEKYNPVLIRIKMAEDRRTVQLKEMAIAYTQRIVEGEEKKKQEEEKYKKSKK